MDIIPNSTHTQSVDYLRVKRPGSDAELSRAEPNSNFGQAKLLHVRSAELIPDADLNYS